jgi:hypothetical protein
LSKVRWEDKGVFNVTCDEKIGKTILSKKRHGKHTVSMR